MKLKSVLGFAMAAFVVLVLGVVVAMIMSASECASPYCVIDLSGGADAESYPVVYVEKEPDGGFNTREYKTVKLVLKRVEPGPNVMGGNKARGVELTKPFYMGLFEVTQKQWELVMKPGARPLALEDERDAYPVCKVSYDKIRGSKKGAKWPESNEVDADSFLGKLRKKTNGLAIDLPMEAQWEYACRAGSTTTYGYGNSPDGSNMWYSANSSSQTHEVGTRLPNSWGFYDMHGNAGEMCLDWYGSGSASGTDPKGPPSGQDRVGRGGSCVSIANSCTSHSRENLSPSRDFSYFGFRLCLTEGQERKSTEENVQTNVTEQVQKRNVAEPRLVKTSTPAGWTDDFDEAKRRAVAEDKFILADFSGSDWCGWCKKLDKEVFAKEEFLSAATNKFVLLMIDSPRDKTLLSKKAAEQNPGLVRKYGIDGFPTVLVLDWDGVVLYRTGYRAGGPSAYLKGLEENQFIREEARTAEEKKVVEKKCAAREREAEQEEMKRDLAETKRKLAEAERRLARQSAEEERKRTEGLVRKSGSSCEVRSQARRAPREASLLVKDWAINWESASLERVLQAYCAFIGKMPIVEPECRLSARITLKTPEGQSLTRGACLNAVRTALEMNGLHLEDYEDDFILVLPRKDVCRKGIPILQDSDAVRLGNGMSIVSAMIPFENISADDAQKVLEGCKSSEGQLVVFAHTNKILVTDAERNIKRMFEIARAIDVAVPATEQAFVRQVKHASATDIKAVLDQIVRDSQKPQSAQSGRSLAPAPLVRGRNTRSPQPAENNASLRFDISDADRGIIRGRVTIAAEEHANKLVIVASKENMDFFDKVIESLDVENQIRSLDLLIEERNK